MVVAILVAILDFSVSSRIFACYPPDFHYRDANHAKSTVKKTLSFQAGYTWVAPRLKDDCKLLQDDSNCTYSWTDSFIVFYPAKCKQMRIGTSTIDDFTYTMGPQQVGLILEKSVAEKDVGDSEASWATFFQMFVVLIQFI